MRGHEQSLRCRLGRCQQGDDRQRGGHGGDRDGQERDMGAEGRCHAWINQRTRGLCQDCRWRDTHNPVGQGALHGLQHQQPEGMHPRSRRGRNAQLSWREQLLPDWTRIQRNRRERAAAAACRVGRYGKHANCAASHRCVHAHGIRRPDGGTSRGAAAPAPADGHLHRKLEERVRRALHADGRRARAWLRRQRERDSRRRQAVPRPGGRHAPRHRKSLQQVRLHEHPVRCVPCVGRRVHG